MLRKPRSGRFDEADDLRNCLAFDAVIAWRVFDVHKGAKAEPDALDFFEEDELNALHVGMKAYNCTKIRSPPFDKLTIREAAIDVGRYVGSRYAVRCANPPNANRCREPKTQKANEIPAPGNANLQGNQNAPRKPGVNNGIVTGPACRKIS